MIKIYSIPDFKLINELRYDPLYGYLKAISPDGKYLVLCSKNDIISILSESGMRMEYGSYFSYYPYLIFSPDNKYIALKDKYAYYVEIWSLSDGSLVKTIPGGRSTSGIFSPDSKYLASYTWDYIKIWSIPDGNLIKEIQVNSISLKSIITFHPKGKYLVALERFKKECCIWSLFDYSLIKTFSLEGYNDFSDLVFSPDGKYLALKGDEEIVVFNTELLNLLQYEYTNSDIEKLQKLLNIDVNKMFILSAGIGSKENIKKLLEIGANVNAKDKDGTPALIYAVRRGDAEIVKMLLERGADVNAKNNYGNTALILAAARGNVDIVKILLDAGAYISAKNKYGETALMLAQYNNQVDTIKILEVYLLNKYVGKQQESISYDVKKTIPSSREESISEVERDYDIIREIGICGMCKVYEIKDKKLGKKYAMKVLSDELKVSRRERESFLQEAKRLAMIDKHEAIVDIYRVIDETDKGANIYLILEYVDGKTINEILDERGRIDWKEVVRIVLDICEALSFAHKNKVIHRDLKLSNIMLTIDGKVKVLDFGIARELKDTISRISGKDTSGTLVYMSPEQHLGSYDERSDIYSLGVTMYEMLTGEVPFKGPEFYLQKTQMVYRPASEIVPDIPKRIDEIIAKCLQADKEKRYQSVEELLNDLKELNSL